MASKQPSQRVTRYAARLGKSVSQLTPSEYKAARGHAATPEHGRTFKGTPYKVSLPGRTIVTTGSDKRAETFINHAADHGNRVQIKVMMKDGTVKTVGGSRGYSASYVAGEAGNAGGIRGAVGGLPGAGSGDAYDLSDVDDDDIDGWQIDELEV